MVLSGHLTGIDRPPMFVPTSRQHFDDEQADLLLRNNLCLCYAYPVVCIDILAPSFPHIWVFNCMGYSPSSAAMRCLWSLLTYFSVGYVYAIGPKDVSIISRRRLTLYLSLIIIRPALDQLFGGIVMTEVLQISNVRLIKYVSSVAHLLYLSNVS